MSRDWIKNLRNIEPYIPGEQSKDKNIVKINANENPYPPSPKAMAVLKSFDANNLRFYPNANSTKLKEAIAKFYGVGVENVFVGNGSDDVLAVAFQSFFNSDKPIVYPDLTYSFYPVWCSLFGIKYKTYPVDDNFRINPEDYKEQNGGVVIPNPNAPTSLGEGLDFVEKILDYNNDSVVIIDEAYVDFGGTSSVSLIEKYEKLAVKEREKVNQVYVLVHGEKCFSEEDINAFIEADVITAEQSDQYIEKLGKKREIAGETMQQTRSEAVCAILKKDLANLYDEIKYDLEPKLTGGFDE